MDKYTKRNSYKYKKELQRHSVPKDGLKTFAEAGKVCFSFTVVLNPTPSNHNSRFLGTQ